MWLGENTKQNDSRSSKALETHTSCSMPFCARAKATRRQVSDEFFAARTWKKYAVHTKSEKSCTRALQIDRAHPGVGADRGAC